MYDGRRRQRCDACSRGFMAAPRCGCCSAWCSPVSLLLFAIGVSSDARCSCARLSTCVQLLPTLRTRLCCMHCRSICTLTKG